MNRVNVGPINVNWNSAGTRILKYSVEIYDNGLNEHKIISAPDLEILQNKINLQMNKWDEKWNKEEKRKEKLEHVEANIEESLKLTRDAEEAINNIEHLLIHTLSIDDSINWDVLKRYDEYPIIKPVKPIMKTKLIYPYEPLKEEVILNLFEKLFKSKREKKLEEYNKRHLNAISEWEKQKIEIDNKNLLIEQQYKIELTQWEEKVREWEGLRANFISEREAFNKKIEDLKLSYFDLNEAAVIEYCEMVLENSEYPETFPKSYELEYGKENKILIVEYQLPSIECFPKLKEVKYLATKKELKEFYLSSNQIQKLFDDSIYKICLRTLHELFESDKANAIDAIAFNGWVTDINRATGKEESNCIVTIQVKKENFIHIDLANVDPKICFKNLKGVAASKLSSLSPVKPILQINKNDRRFVESYDVINSFDETTNLAAMNWEDFEHLIREIFEKEFQTNGGEVKVTQASRDGGVDAIAFDPDPIRGGKIVIQAKRYTNTVGLSAVRDLYGTVVNEGATKGILVTTADYGPDAYEFAKDKPLTLLSGANLLHLLEKHGHRAKIDIREAKRIISENR